MKDEEIDDLPEVEIDIPEGEDEIEFLKTYLGGEYVSHEDMPPDDEIEGSFVIKLKKSKK